jgi:hypothetical protein
MLISSILFFGRKLICGVMLRFVVVGLAHILLIYGFVYSLLSVFDMSATRGQAQCRCWH